MLLSFEGSAIVGSAVEGCNDEGSGAEGTAGLGWLAMQTWPTLRTELRVGGVEGAGSGWK